MESVHQCFLALLADLSFERYVIISHFGLDLFIRKGYAATKISDIAEHVGMSVGLLFYYFESKDTYALATAYWCAIQGIAEQMAMKPDTPCPESDWINLPCHCQR